MNYEKLKELHPCFAGGPNSGNGRIHLPVSPTCNIECKFCKRDFNDFEQAPGVSNTILKPIETVDAIRRAKELCPEITVAGIAGPGDTLASTVALDSFRLIKNEFPEIIKCMSTNGLLLDEKADEIIEIGIESLTVTVNAVDPEILVKINGGITYHGKHYDGIEAAEILIKNQLSGIKKIADAGITVKVNTVLIPEVNDHHIEAIAKTVSEAGAKLYNIIPLIPRHEFSEHRSPICSEIDGARVKAEKYLNVFRHCQHCRADAVGKLGGEDFGEKIYKKRVKAEETFSHG